jgi:hypothetical protein
MQDLDRLPNHPWFPDGTEVTVIGGGTPVITEWS